MKTYRFFLTTIILIFISLAVPAQTNVTIPYSGFLTDAGGIAVNGSVTMTFKLYTSETGSILWQDTMAIDVVDGEFSVILGSNTPIPGIHVLIYELWLGITVETDPEMSPRLKIASVPYSYRATVADDVPGMDITPNSVSTNVLNTQSILINSTEVIDSTGTFIGTIIEADPVFSASEAAGITTADILNWNTETDPIFSASPAFGITLVDIANWNTEIDPVFSASPAFGITLADITNWNTETDPVFFASPAFGITLADIANWNTAFSWGNHADVGYVQSETDPVFINSPAYGITATDIANWYLDETGILTETDPTIPAAIKDGIDWSELTGIPADIADGDQGNGDSHSLDSADGSITDVVYVDFAGNTGINTTSPVAALDVRGSVNISEVLHLQPLDTAPLGQLGDLYVGTDGNILFHNGTAWKRLLLETADIWTWQEQTGSGIIIMGSIACSADCTKLAVCPQYGYIYTSTDSGVTWTEQTGAGIRYWASLASSADGTILAAGTWGEYIYISYDSGVTWTQIGVLFGSCPSIVCSSDGSKFATFVVGGYIYTFSDSGFSWTIHPQAGKKNWECIACSTDGTKLAAVTWGGYIYTSSDSGVTWTEQTGAGSRYWRKIVCSADGRKLAAYVNAGYIYTSSDSGVSWAVQTGAGNKSWYSITCSANGTKLAVCNFDDYIYTSPDSGVTWIEQTSAGNRAWSAIASSADGTKLAACANGGYIYTGTYE